MFGKMSKIVYNKAMELKYVDGYKIRQTLDPDFNVIHYYKPEIASPDSKFYIPQGEIWLDSCFKDEENYLKTFLMENLSRAEAKKLCKEGQAPDFVIREENENDIKIQYVDGKIIREYFDPYFVMGGHDLVYPYVPAKTIWIDNKIDKRDIPHVLIHESTERKLMSEGKTYDVAHDFATAAEKESRRADGGTYMGDVNCPEEFSIKNYYAR